MKYCCEKCFACEPPFGDFLIKNHEKTGTCEYCGAENVKLIDAKKMREVIMDRIDEEYEAVTEVDHEGESYCTFYGVPAYELDYILELIDDALLAETEWYKNKELYYDVFDKDDYEDVWYVAKSDLDEIRS